MQNWFALSDPAMEEALHEIASFSSFARLSLEWHIAAHPSDIAKLPECRAKMKFQKTEHGKASARAKVEYPFRVIKRQFGLVKVRFRGLAKNTAHVVTLFALSNLWMARRKLMAMMGEVRPKAA
jgi:IS5 family transposase